MRISKETYLAALLSAFSTIDHAESLLQRYRDLFAKYVDIELHIMFLE